MQTKNTADTTEIVIKSSDKVFLCKLINFLTNYPKVQDNSTTIIIKEAGRNGEDFIAEKTTEEYED